MEAFVKFLVYLIVALIFDLILAWCVMLLWNGLLPELFSFPTVTFWQSFGLMVLVDILFKNRLSLKE